MAGNVLWVWDPEEYKARTEFRELKDQLDAANLRIVNLIDRRDEAEDEADALRDKLDAALAVVRAPTSENDGGAADLAEEMCCLLHNANAYAAESIEANKRAVQAETERDSALADVRSDSTAWAERFRLWGEERDRAKKAELDADNWRETANQLGGELVKIEAGQNKTSDRYRALERQLVRLDKEAEAHFQRAIKAEDNYEDVVRQLANTEDTLRDARLDLDESDHTVNWISDEKAKVQDRLDELDIELGYWKRCGDEAEKGIKRLRVEREALDHVAREVADYLSYDDTIHGRAMCRLLHGALERTDKPKPEVTA